jgi:hypothetical protein
MPAAAQSQFIAEWKEFMPLVGAVVVAVTGAVVAFFVTWRLNTAMKQTEFFLRFTERFHNILQAKHQLELKKKGSPDTAKLDLATVEKETRELYRQLFGLMFDEFFAYRKGFLDRDAFAEWMRWRHFEHAGTSSGPNFAIANTSYESGWKAYCDGHSAHPEFKAFLDRVHAAKDPDEVSRLVLAHAPRAQRLSAKIRGFMRDWRIVVGFLAAVALFSWVASLMKCTIAIRA